MNRRKLLMQMIGLSLVLLVLNACGNTGPSVSGMLTPWGEDIPIAGRQVVLCHIVGEGQELPADCVLWESAVVSGENGEFEFYDVPAGAYYVLYDSGRGDFDAGLERWGGQTFSWDDSEWQKELFWEEAPDDGMAQLLVPRGYELNDDWEFLLAYFPATLMLGDSPFIVAHDTGQAVEDHVLELVVVEVTEELPGSVEFPVLEFGDGRSGTYMRVFE
ncbi:MAG: hypothetical protein WBB65_02630 [Anaerolineales bacterium]